MICEKKLIEAIDKEIKRAKERKSEGLSKIVMGLIISKEIIEEQPKVGEWIPCSEILPENRKDKLVYLSSNRITIATYNEHRLPHSGEPIGWGYDEKYGYMDFAKEYVVAWMPLPEQYQAKELE